MDHACAKNLQCEPQTGSIASQECVATPLGAEALSDPKDPKVVVWGLDTSSADRRQPMTSVMAPLPPIGEVGRAGGAPSASTESDCPGTPVDARWYPGLDLWPDFRF